ncbi:homoprotocatechuate degradation operon regulator HpaR [Aliisedimentitalea scapharcae]|uniref:Homoprotocatechuate degradation operon regulator HpaR n=1 Tax=Aliisedimentitalea scapharcae TaxID=1524259 RepID=A0ABZ2XRI6_9RHOB|nr:homoprotocatechuate degradation operon regulator HpaR [Rhodobacteraceae bacterium M382]
MNTRLPSTSRSLPIALLRAREQVMGPIRAMLSESDVTEQQWRVLRVLEEDGPMEPTRIAELACLLLPSLTRILQKLEEKQLISRERDTVDRRKQVVRISEAGSALIATNLEASVALMDNVRHRMGQDRYEALLDLLNELDQIGDSDV